MLTRACRLLFPYFATAFGLIKLDAMVDVASYLSVIEVPLLICGVVLLCNAMLQPGKV